MRCELDFSEFEQRAVRLLAPIQKVYIWMKEQII